MKKILLLILASASIAHAGALTHTTAQVDTVVSNALAIGTWSLGDTTYTNTVLSASYTTNAPATVGFGTSFASSTDITVDPTNATFLCNFDGYVSVSVATSATILSPQTDVLIADIFLDETNTDFGFNRSISTSSGYGSAAGCHPALAVTNGSVITVQHKLGAADKSVVYHTFCTTVKRIQ